MDEVFGAENFVAQINFKSMQALGQSGLAKVYDYLLWYARDTDRLKFRPLFGAKEIEDDKEYRFIDDPEAELGYRKLTEEEFSQLTDYTHVFRRSALTSSGYTPSCTFSFELNGTKCKPFGAKSWRTNPDGIDVLKSKSRLFLLGGTPYFKLYYPDFPFIALENSWTEQAAAETRLYVVQTGLKFIQRCLLMTTDPGDLVLDTTCGSGSTAYVAEQWGRRWITCDTSRVPLALTRQRILTASFPWYELIDEAKGPSAGFVYERRQNRKGEDTGGIVPHITLGSIANNEPAATEVLVDKPEQNRAITRTSGPFCVEATIPTPMDWDEPTSEAQSIEQANEGSFSDRMLEVLRRSPVLRLEGNRTVTLKNVRRPAKSLSLSAEALVDATAEGQTATLADAMQEAAEKSGLALPMSSRPVAFVFGPENGAVSVRTVEQAAREAYQKCYTHLYVIGFAIQANAREAIEESDAVSGIPATYVQATPDLMMGDLLKNMRSSQIFSVCGLPEIRVGKAKPTNGDTETRYEVELLGLDVFDPVEMVSTHRNGDDVPAWFLDSDYNEMCFHVSQAFFPRTNEWDKLKKALKGEFEDSVWEHLAGTTSAPFMLGEHRRIAVKVIDDRGNELLVVKQVGA